MWAHLVFGGVLNLVEKGFCLKIGSNHVECSLECNLIDGSMNIADIYSKEHLVCIYGSICGLLYCLGSSKCFSSETTKGVLQCLLLF